MILENLYKDDFKCDSDKHVTQIKQWCDAFRVPLAQSYDISKMYDYIDTIERNIQSLKSNPPMKYSYSIDTFVTNYYNRLTEEHVSAEKALYQQLLSKKEELKQSNEHANQTAYDEYKESRNPLIQKQIQLKSYQGKLIEYMDAYGVTAADVKITDELSDDELSAMYDVTINTCQKLLVAKKANPFTKLLIPFKSTLDARIILTYFCLLLILLWFITPFLSFPFFAYVLYNTFLACKQLDDFKLAIALMHKDLLSADLPQETEVDYTEVNRWYQEQRQLLQQDNPELTLEELRKDATVAQEGVDNKCVLINMQIEDYYNDVLKQLDIELEQLQKIRDEKIAASTNYLDIISNHEYLSDKIVLHALNGDIQVQSDIDYSNYTFTDKNVLYLYLSNILLGVKEKHLRILYFDPLGLGVDISEFATASCGEYIQLITGDIPKEVSNVRKILAENIARLDGQTIDVYNKACEESGKITLDYTLAVVLSGNDEFMKQPTVSSMLEYSAKNGVLFWFLSDTLVTGTINIKLQDFGRIHAMEYAKDIGKHAMRTYMKAYNDSKTAALDYFTKFANKYIPKENWFTKNTIHGIDIRFGLQDGDPSLGKTITLCDGCVHMLTSGVTGSGKSALVNTVIASLISDYSPEELEIINIDFKNSEAAKLADGDGLCIIPHITILSGTKDGEYALSIFNYLREEMERRQVICKQYGESNIEDVRMKHPEVVVPRILVIFDEFKVMFGASVSERVRTKIVGEIDDLAILARAYGIHMWFIAQNLKGTLSQSTLGQFTARACLHSDREVSQYVLNAPDAATRIKTSCGYIVTNLTGGNDPTACTLWRIPFIPTSAYKNLAHEISAYATEHNHTNMHKASLFDETALVPSSRLNQWYQQYPSVFENKTVFILGERTSYTQNKAPITLKLMPDSKENVLAAAVERQDYLNLVMTFIDNIKMHGCPVLINSADKDTIKLLELDKLVDESFVPALSPDYDIDDLLKCLEQIIVARRNNSPEENKPFYFMGLQWEKRSGVTVDISYAQKVEDRLTSILREGPSLGLYSIFVCKEINNFSSWFLNSSVHHICAKVNEMTSGKLLNDDRAFKLPSAKDGIFAYYNYSTEYDKFKIYQHEFTVTIESREVVIK